MDTLVSKELKDWLQFRWKRDNHSKYQHLFEVWLKNLTQDQIDGFNKQFNSVLGQDIIWK